MDRASGSSERTPLVQPAYVFEATRARRFQRKLKHFQCAVCLTFVTALGVALLVTISYSLANGTDPTDDNGTTTEIPEVSGNLTSVPPELGPLLKLRWPLKGRPNPIWVTQDLPPEVLSKAIAQGSSALESRSLLEASRAPLSIDSPAGRAQRAAATSVLVKPLSDTGYAVEEATRSLLNGTTVTRMAPGSQSMMGLFGITSHSLGIDLQIPTAKGGSLNLLLGMYSGAGVTVPGANRPPMKRYDGGISAFKASPSSLHGLPIGSRNRNSDPRVPSRRLRLPPSAVDICEAIPNEWSVLLRSNNTSQGNVGVGPSTNGTWLQPKYCQVENIKCNITKYRSIDGSCNNLQHPQRWGVAYTPFRRALPPVYGDGISSPRSGTTGQLPSARDVSVTVHRPAYAHDTVFTVMLAVWGQFIDHDITATALSKGVNSTLLSCCDNNQSVHPECFPVRLDKEDPFYQNYNVTCMEFVRSASAPTCHYGPREQLNQATAYLDGSTVYGYTEERAMRLRTAEGGLLRMMKRAGRDLLPPSTDSGDGCNTLEMNQKGRYCFDTGDDRANENLHLTTMHLIWARQHNRLALELQKLNPSWDDQIIYMEARRILGAQMQHITYTEFLPTILGADVMLYLNLSVQSSGYSYQYEPGVEPTIANHFSAAAFRFAHTLLPGLIHKFDSDHNTVDYVHLHEMLFNPYDLYRDDGSQRSVRSALNTPVHSVDPHVTAELSNHLFERPSTNITKKAGPCGLDLVSLNIQRGRDHGLPGYPAWREHCGFKRPKSFDDLKGVFDESSLERISTIYGSVDDIDLYTGALAETPRGRLLGGTLTCLLADQFLRLKIGDRFWYETGDPDVRFTYDQLTEIRKTSLAGVICSNEDLRDIQPRVMELLSPTNPLVRCQQIPQPSLVYWKSDK